MDMQLTHGPNDGALLLTLHRGYDEVGWSSKLPHPIPPPVTTLEPKPDPVTTRLNVKWLEDAPSLWQVCCPLLYTHCPYLASEQGTTRLHTQLFKSLAYQTKHVLKAAFSPFHCSIVCPVTATYFVVSFCQSWLCRTSGAVGAQVMGFSALCSSVSH